MSYASLVITFLKALPDIVKLLSAIQSNIEKAQSEEAMQRKVTDDLKQLHEAFNEKDPEAAAKKLRAIFNN